RIVLAATATKNIEGDKVGFLNRAFGHVYQVRVLGKKIKAFNLPLYYALQYGLYALLIYLIFFCSKKTRPPLHSWHLQICWELQQSCLPREPGKAGEDNAARYHRPQLDYGNGFQRLKAVADHQAEVLHR